MTIRITILSVLMAFCSLSFAQSSLWGTHYAVLDDQFNGTGYQTSSVAATGDNNFVALVTETPGADIFNPPGNYLVGYFAADSAQGRVPSPINGQSTTPGYGAGGQFTAWESGLDQITFKGAWQMASGGPDNYVYVANNDDNHNILVFDLSFVGVSATENRMQTGTENIFAIEVDDSGYVYVADYEGTDSKTDEIKVFAPIGSDGSTWGTFGGHNDAPVATIDLPIGIYQGLTVSGDGTQVFVSASNDRAVYKYSGSPETGYSIDDGFSFQLAADDTIGNGGFGTPTVLGMAYLNEPASLFVVADSFLHIGGNGGYNYGRIYRIGTGTGAPLDTLDVAEWNLAVTGSYSTGSGNGRAGGFTSLCDVDVDQEAGGVYTQSYYGWAVEKWIFDGTLTDIDRISANAPEGYTLRQNYPNPFNPKTQIEFALGQAGLVDLAVYNVLGQKVATLINDRMPAGSYQATFDAADLPSGVYIYKLTAGTYSQTMRMVLLK